MRVDDVNGVGMELRDLRLALVTSQHRSLRQAAEALNIRQSTLSRRLHEESIQNRGELTPPVRWGQDYPPGGSWERPSGTNVGECR
jgi:Bacterial regulatory helix-turn-helix protein, lysR family